MGKAAGQERTNLRAACAGVLLLVLLAARPAAPVEVPGTIKHDAALTDDGRVARGYNHLLNLQIDRAIAAFTGPLVQTLRKPLAVPANRKQAARYLVLIACAFDYDGNERAAGQAYGLATQLDPDNLLAASGLARALARGGHTQESERIFARLEPFVGKDRIATRAAGVRALDQRDCPRAVALLKQAAAMDPTDAQAHFFLAKSLFALGLAKESASHYQLAAKYGASPYMNEICLGRAYRNTNMPKLAMEHFLKAGRMLPEDPLWHFQAGYGLTDNPQLWLDHFKKATRCKRLFPAAFLHVSLFQVHQKNYGDAQHYLNFLEMLRPWCAQLYATKGIMQRQMGRPAEAVTLLEKSVALNPFNFPAYTELADTYSSLQNERAALRVATEATNRCRHDWRAWQFLAGHYRQQKQWQDAIDRYATALRLAPSYLERLAEHIRADIARVHAGLGTCYYKQGRVSEAIAAAKVFNRFKYVAPRPRHFTWILFRPERLDFWQSKPPTNAQQAVIHGAMADMLWECGELDDSVAEYRKAIALDPENTDWHMCLLAVLADKKDWASCIRQDFVLTNKLLSKGPQLVREWARRFGLQERQPPPPTVPKLPAGGTG
jgi:tetratricopeptide (TPR) repeat protein